MSAERPVFSHLGFTHLTPDVHTVIFTILLQKDYKSLLTLSRFLGTYQTHNKKGLNEILGCKCHKFCPKMFIQPFLNVMV